MSELIKDQAAHEAARKVADYEHGWVADIEQEYGPKGLSEETVRFISAKKDEPEWMLDWRLKAYRHWLTMPMPDWAKLNVPPVFLKVAPDLEPADVEAIARIALSRRLGALIVSNTTISRPALASRHAPETGGLSGAPLRDLAQQRLIDFRRATGGAIPLIGVGGIATAEDAYARIRAGASLVQLYSAMVYEGHTIARKITRGLKALLSRDGFAHIGDAVGIDVPL